MKVDTINCIMHRDKKKLSTSNGYNYTKFIII